jgi:phosphoglycolate phosphatase-like HAD superfamily hydrolase
MFDIDGTLVESNDFDSECYQAAIQDVLDTLIDTNWDKYKHVTDSGILNQIIDELHLQNDRDLIITSVKERFLHRVSTYLTKHEVSPIRGAPGLLNRLRDREDVKVAMATGGWLESAKLKLGAVGIDVRGIPIASSSDHFSRIEIMKIAELRAGIGQYESRTYFGYSPWDLRASKALGYNFVLVGNRIDYDRSIPDFIAADDVLASIGL